LNIRLVMNSKLYVYCVSCVHRTQDSIINFALAKLLRTATEEKVRERQREAQRREGTLKYTAAWLSPKSFYKILV